MNASLTSPQRGRLRAIVGLMRLAIAIGFATLAIGQANAQQQVAMSLGSGSTTPGSTVALAVSMTASGGALPTSLQWTMGYPADVTGVTVVGGPKTASCSSTSGSTTCLMFDVTTNVIPNGSIATATFTISAGSVSTSVPITLSGMLASDAAGNSIPTSGTGGTITVIQPTLVTPSGVTCNPASVNAPGTSACTVTLSGAAPGGGLAVALSSNNANATVPASVTATAGTTTVGFTATVASITTNQTATLTATANSTAKTTSLSLVAPAQLSGVSCAPSTLGTAQASTCTVTLNKAALSTATVSLSSNTGVLTVPASMTIATNASSGTFTATAGTVSSNATATVTATLNAQTVNTTVSLVTTVTPSGITCNPASVNAPGTAACTVTLSGAAPGGGLAVALSSNNANATVPASVTATPGAITVGFTATVASITTNQTATLTATANITSQTSSLSLVAPAQLSSVSCAPSTLGTAQTSTCTVTLNKAALSTATVSLSSNTGVLTVPASMTIATNASSGTFTATAGTVSSNATATITASLNGQNQAATISLAAAAQLSGVNCSPATVNAPGASTCTVSLTVASTGAVSVTLLSNNTSVTVPASANIGAGLNSATFTAAVATIVSDQTALLTASLNGVSQTFTLTAKASAQPAQLTSLACTPSTLGSNASSICTVTLNATASSATVVSLSSNSGLLSAPSSVTVPSGQSGVSFTATSGTVPGAQNATLTAGLNGQSQSATISLTPTVQLGGLSCSPAAVTAPGNSSCAVTLTAATPGALSVTLSSNNTSVTVPGSLNIGTGLSSATFTAAIAAVVSNQTAVLTATLNGASQTFTLTANASGPVQITSLSCAPSALASSASTTCTLTLSGTPTSATIVSLVGINGLLSVPPSVTVPAGKNSTTFAAIAGNVSSSQNATVTATLNGQTQSANISLAPAANCEEFQTSPGGQCMIQDILPWVTFGGGWESRLSAGNIPSAAGGGNIQFSFVLLPPVPVAGGVQNHLPAFFTDNQTGQPQLAESATYTLALGQSVAVNFLSPPAGCDIHGQNCASSPDPNTMAYGAIMVQYVADNPAFLRGIAKAQLTFLLANAANGNYAWQTTENEVPPAKLWTAPVAVSADQNSNPQTSQQASAALANPGPSAITVRGTLYNANGGIVTSQDFQIPPLGVNAFSFTNGFGNAMFPLGQDFTGQVAFQVISPNNGSVSAMVLQEVGNAMSTVALSGQGPTSVVSGANTLCAEFATAPDGTCTTQYYFPWVVFGGGWESRLKAAYPPSATAGPVQLRFTLLPVVSATGGLANHLPAYFTDSRTGQLQARETANYTVNASQSVDVNFLYPPAGCDVHGQNCASQGSPNTLSYGSMLVQYSSTDPASLRALANPQLAFLERPGGQSYSSQIAEQGAATSAAWTAPVAVSADPNAGPQTRQQVSAAITNPGQTAVTVRGTLRDQNGTVITYNDFQIPASGTIAMVFALDPSQPFGGFGNAMFPSGQDFKGWVTFAVTSPSNGGVSVIVLQYIGDTVSSVNVQSFP